ncbi:MAG: xanthine dehydrogenase family protein molybdopterin-binding subunit [Planctomycetota bacterium]
MSARTLPRREFLRASVALGGGLLIAFRWPDKATARAMRTSSPADAFAPNAFVRIAADGAVTVIVNKSEMGQGVCTSMSMLLADELDADWTRVGFEFAPVDPVYVHPGFGIQMTGGSTSTFAMSEPMRKAGAVARAMLVAAAAQAWGVAAGECRTENGAVLHDATSRRSLYGELATSAAALPVPQDVPLKEPSAFRLIGKPTKRLDTPDKIAGKAMFSSDVMLPGMLTAMVQHPPVFGARARAIRADAARAVPGVRDVVDVGSGVAVIATGFWPAKRGRGLLDIDWDLGASAQLSSDRLREEYRRLAQSPGRVARNDGDPSAALQSAARVLNAEFELPYLAHAPMEPLNCVVDLRADACEVWAGTQFQTVDHAAIARTAGLAPAQVTLHTTFMGGGFGRRANPASDYIVEAVKIARAAKAPVKLVWTREDDLQGGYYRPMWHSRISAALDAAGGVSAWTHTIVGQSFIVGTPFEQFIIKDGIDGTSVEGAADLPYAIQNVRVDLHTTSVAVPTLWWRSVGHSHTAFVVESFVDEIAHATSTDPLELRRRWLAGKTRHLGVLERAAAAAGWGKPLAAGHAHGIAVHHSFESYVASVAEVSLDRGRPRVHRYTCAVDCGRVVNPDTVKAQLEGAVGFGLTAALYGAITLRDGRVEQSNFHDYQMLRIHEMPAVDVHIVASDEPSSGIGEPGVPPVAPALCNALFALTGKRIRRLPIRGRTCAHEHDQDDAADMHPHRLRRDCAARRPVSRAGCERARCAARACGRCSALARRARGVASRVSRARAPALRELPPCGRRAVAGRRRSRTHPERPARQRRSRPLRDALRHLSSDAEPPGRTPAARRPWLAPAAPQHAARVRRQDARRSVPPAQGPQAQRRPHA